MATLMQDPGEKSLDKLLATLTTVVHPDTYVFAALAKTAPPPPLAEMQLLFRESEAVTVIVRKAYADDNRMDYFFASKMLTLNVTSSLEAVGFMAVIATRLATLGMGVNPVSGFYHDHLFVPEGREAEAVEELRKLAEEKRRELE
ncbi:hypothetical protein LLEC1_04351 [Akanthomyces lecanii]|uniref:DUF2241 domain-containing protein n=1 Tax=Cordyceps confragosa TaxID=2714763 RepID=A0A179I579_CORDF|nr:hypothetical protein LLEC1_04351 [Akanthomyces lecanii]